MTTECNHTFNTQLIMLVARTGCKLEKTAASGYLLLPAAVDKYVIIRSHKSGSWRIWARNSKLIEVSPNLNRESADSLSWFVIQIVWLPGVGKSSILKWILTLPATARFVLKHWYSCKIIAITCSSSTFVLRNEMYLIKISSNNDRSSGWLTVEILEHVLNKSCVKLRAS